MQKRKVQLLNYRKMIRIISLARCGIYNFPRHVEHEDPTLFAIKGQLELEQLRDWFTSDEIFNCLSILENRDKTFLTLRWSDDAAFSLSQKNLYTFCFPTLICTSWYRAAPSVAIDVVTSRGVTDKKKNYHNSSVRRHDTGNYPTQLAETARSGKLYRNEGLAALPMY